MRTLLLAFALLLALPTAAAGFPIETPGDDHNHDGDLDAGRVCVWGWGDECVLRAYPCFQPHAPGFGINCV